MEALEQLEDLFQGFGWEMAEFLNPPGTNIAVVIGEIAGEGGRSGAQVNSPWCVVVELERGMVSRGRTYTSKAEALEAVGLSE